MLGVGRNYISEKKKDPAFQKRYREFKQDLLKKTSEQLLAYNLDAIKTLILIIPLMLIMCFVCHYIVSLVMVESLKTSKCFLCILMSH